jgi:hypothetical protein
MAIALGFFPERRRIFSRPPCPSIPQKQSHALRSNDRLCPQHQQTDGRKRRNGRKSCDRRERSRCAAMGDAAGAHPRPIACRHAYPTAAAGLATARGVTPNSGRSGVAWAHLHLGRADHPRTPEHACGAQRSSTASGFSTKQHPPPHIPAGGLRKCAHKPLGAPGAVPQGPAGRPMHLEIYRNG